MHMWLWVCLFLCLCFLLGVLLSHRARGVLLFFVSFLFAVAFRQAANPRGSGADEEDGMPSAGAGRCTVHSAQCFDRVAPVTVPLVTGPGGIRGWFPERRWNLYLANPPSA